MSEVFKSFTEAMTAMFKEQSPKTFLHEFKSLDLDDKLDFWTAFNQSGYNVPLPAKPANVNQEDYDAALKRHGVPVS